MVTETFEDDRKRRPTVAIATVLADVPDREIQAAVKLVELLRDWHKSMGAVRRVEPWKLGGSQAEEVPLELAWQLYDECDKIGVAMDDEPEDDRKRCNVPYSRPNEVGAQPCPNPEPCAVHPREELKPCPRCGNVFRQNPREAPDTPAPKSCPLADIKNQCAQYSNMEGTLTKAELLHVLNYIASKVDDAEAEWVEEVRLVVEKALEAGKP